MKICTNKISRYTVSFTHTCTYTLNLFLLIGFMLRVENLYICDSLLLSNLYLLIGKSRSCKNLEFLVKYRKHSYTSTSKYKCTMPLIFISYLFWNMLTLHQFSRFGKVQSCMATPHFFTLSPYLKMKASQGKHQLLSFFLYK